MDVFDSRVLPICREVLLFKKQRLLNGLFDRSTESPLFDEIDEQQEQLSFPRFEQNRHGLRTRIQHQLYEIEHALAKIQNGVFGFCERTGKPIERFRILAMPWARYGGDVDPSEIPEESMTMPTIEAL